MNHYKVEVESLEENVSPLRVSRHRCEPSVWASSSYEAAVMMASTMPESYRDRYFVVVVTLKDPEGKKDSFTHIPPWLRGLW